MAGYAGAGKGGSSLAALQKKTGPSRGRSRSCIAEDVSERAQEQIEVRHVQRADARARLVAAAALVVPVVALADVVEAAEAAVAEDVLQRIHLRIPEAHAAVPALRQQRADAVELRRHEAGAAVAGGGAAVDGGHHDIAGLRIRVERDVRQVAAVEIARQ